MNVNSSSLRAVLVLAILAALPATMVAQHKSGGSPGSPSKPGIGSTTSTSTQPTISARPIFISGKVLVDGGGSPPEPAVIERICNGTTRRQGYTDGKGAFQFQLDQNPAFQDASETTNSSDPFSTVRSNSQSLDAVKLQYQGCEIRAVLSGFVSSTVSLRLQGSTWEYDLGTILLKRMENVPGTTISMTTMNAPNDAKHAYEKGRKAFDAGKYPDAEKDLNKAVKIYPNFAAAWSLLGDIHQQQKQLDQATTEYKQALAADPRFVNPSFGLALIAVQEKRWQDAVQFTDQVVKMNSLAYPSAYFYNAVANYNLGKIDPAEISVRKFKSVDADHRHPDASLLLGQILMQKNDFGAAAQEIREYLSHAPDAPNAEKMREWLKHYEASSVAKQQ